VDFLLVLIELFR